MLTEISLYNYENSKACDLVTIDETFYPLLYAWAIQSNAPYLDIFNKRLELDIVLIVKRAGLFLNEVTQIRVHNGFSHITG